MRKIIALGVFLVIIAVLWGGLVYRNQEAKAAPSTDTVIVLQDNKLMVVLWLSADEQFLQFIRGPATFETIGNKMYMNGAVIVNNLTKVGFGVYPYQEIPPKYEWDEELQTPVEAPQYMYELNLQPIDADDLPHSQHIAKLVGINSQAVKPAIIARKYLGEVFTMNCLVSQSAKDHYLGGILQVGDYVVVSFIDEIPDTTELNICILTNKVWESW